MQQAGLTPAPALEVDFNADELAPSVLAHLTSGPNRPTALFCSNDLLAMVVMRGLRRARLQIPRDMSILGFDGLAMGELLSPPLASVCAPNREIGCAAWERLLARVTGTYDTSGETSRTLTLPHSVREGATIAAISNRAENSPAHASTSAEEPFA
jgi:DNA-binding LacI/PurR family transcriptional regulator